MIPVTINTTPSPPIAKTSARLPPPPLLPVFAPGVGVGVAVGVATVLETGWVRELEMVSVRVLETGWVRELEMVSVRERAMATVRERTMAMAMATVLGIVEA